MINKKLLNWSQEMYGDLPWRKKSRSLYTTLVSEIMLQQTTVGTVLKKFDGFLKKYPTVYDLAQSSEEEVCRAWEGLGYYRRARNLRKAAIAIVEDYDGHFPGDVESLKKIPGVGDYTANALVSIGANEVGLAIDANLERVIARYYNIPTEKGLRLHREIKERFSRGEILKEMAKHGHRVSHEALMDLGRVYCQAKKADCHLCPLSSKCGVYNSLISPVSLPTIKDKEKKKESFDLKLIRVVVKGKRGLLGYEKRRDEWLSGQIELPTFVLSTTDKKFSQYPHWEGSFDVSKSRKVKTAITKYKIENFELVLSKKDFDTYIKTQKLSKRAYQYYDQEKSHFSTASLKILSLKS